MIAYIRGELASVEEDRVIVDVPEKWRKKLEEHREMAFLCREHPLDCCPL